MSINSIFFVNNKKYNLSVSGKIIKPVDKIILHEEDNLIIKTNWKQRGYSKFKLLEKKIQSDLQENILNFICKKIQKLFPKIKITSENLKNYHNFISDKQHYKLLKEIENGIKFKDVNFNRKLLESSVSKKLKIKVTTRNPNHKIINPETFAVRIIRPNQNDFNPPHKDIYLDRLKNAVNIYMPIIGSNIFTSLPLMKGSHILNEKNIKRTTNGAIVNKIKFRVPCIINTSKGLKLLRPNPKKDQIMIFSPYLIHGGGSNESKNTTRISLELRFWRA